MKKKLIILTTIISLTSISLFAQIDATGETELYNELKKVDKELNISYRQTLRNLSVDKQKALKEQQRNWIKDRDIKCNNNQEGGVYENKLRLDCLIQETIKRRTELKKLRIERRERK